MYKLAYLYGTTAEQRLYVKRVSYFQTEAFLTSIRINDPKKGQMWNHHRKNVPQNQIKSYTSFSD